MTTAPEQGPHYFLDGWTSDGSELAKRIERLDRAGWALVAVIPHYYSPQSSAPAFGVLAKHPIEELPPWER